MEDREDREKVALFPFGLIGPLLNRTNASRGDQERLIQQITQKEWEIPGTGRSRIGRSTLLRWVRDYQQSGQKLESPLPRARKDRGLTRCLKPELELALVNLRREIVATTLTVFLRIARQRRVLDADMKLSAPSLYRLFQRHGLERPARNPPHRRRFEAELPNDLWQSDALHGPKVLEDGKLRQSFVFALIDDHSRLVL